MLDAVRARIGRRDGGGPFTPSAFRSAAAHWSTGLAAPGAMRSRWSMPPPRSRRRSISRAAASRSARVSIASTRYHFLWTLLPKSLAMAQRFPGRLDADRIRRVRSMHEFDDVVTAPLHGFAGHRRLLAPRIVETMAAAGRCADARAQCAQRSVRAGGSLPGPADVSADVLLEQPEDGGHVGFLSPPLPGKSRLAAAAIGTILHVARLKLSIE